MTKALAKRGSGRECTPSRVLEAMSQGRLYPSVACVESGTDWPRIYLELPRLYATPIIGDGYSLRFLVFRFAGRRIVREAR